MSNIYDLHTEPKNKAELAVQAPVWYCEMQFVFVMNYNQLWFAMENNSWHHIIWLTNDCDYSKLPQAVRNQIKTSVKAIIGINQSVRSFHGELAKQTAVIARVATNEAAIEFAKHLYVAGDVIVVSPFKSIQHFLNQ